MLIKHPDIPVLEEVIFEGFKFHNGLVGPVSYGDTAVVRQARHGTDRGIFGLFDGDVNASLGFIGIGNGFKDVCFDNTGVFNPVTGSIGFIFNHLYAVLFLGLTEKSLLS
jgi:hypothetical protein